MSRDAARIRREQDMVRLRQLIRESDGRIRLIGATGDPVDRLKLVLKYRTAVNNLFPDQSGNSSDVDIVLPARYPFVAPKVTINTPIFHPNVYSSGLVCLGETWIASEGLDLLVRRLIRLVTFDPLVSGGMPPANQMASSWYHKKRKQSPDAFPTEVVRFEDAAKQSRISFADVKQTQHPKRTVVACNACGKSLRLPAGKRGRVKCPGCDQYFEAVT